MISWIVTGGLIPVFLLLAGVFFLIWLRGYPFRSPRGMIRSLREPMSGGTPPFRALMLALAGTLGVGNIVGVANAVYLGGAGAVFWMWVSALLAMILKYAEIVLAVAHRRFDKNGKPFGGAVYYIKDHFLSSGHHRTAAILSSFFAVLMIVDALSMGCVIQVNAVASAWEGVAGIPTWFTGLLLLLLALPVLMRGRSGVTALTEYLVPVMTAGYIILSAAVLILRRDVLGGVFAEIFRQAFTPQSAFGGFAGVLTSQALRAGTMRGLLSNEAGCGTAPTAHAGAAARVPASQGLWGILEVFVDTILLCTATALVILSDYGEVAQFGVNGVMMTIRAYGNVLGGFASWFFAAAVFCFGYATVLCWGNYGLESLRYLTRDRRWTYVYFVLIALCVVFGAVSAPGFVWDVADFTIAALTTVNLVVLFRMRKEIRSETESWRKIYQYPQKSPKKRQKISKNKKKN